MANGPTYLDNILEYHRKRAQDDVRPIEKLRRTAEVMKSTKDFNSALSRPGLLSLIAEVKRRSPSKGDIDIDLDPLELSAEYEQCGASAISVLTDQEFFGGSLDDLEQVSSARNIPVLRKDFTVCERDIYQARISGADAVLLIVSALDKCQLLDYYQIVSGLGMSALIEVHDEHELEVALEVGVKIVGVNQRDLYSFDVDPTLAERLVSLIPINVTKVAESGILLPGQADSLAACGYDSVLIGQALVQSSNRQEFITAVLSSPKRTLGEYS